MTITTKSAIRRTARLGTCFLIGAAALTACGEGSDDVATTSGAVPAAAPAAPYVSPEQADREALLALRAERASEPIEGRAVESTSAHTSIEESLERRALSDGED